MFVDASAMIAMLVGEAGAVRLADDLAAADNRMTSAIAVYETVTALCRVRSYSVPEARDVVARLLSAGDIRIVPIGEAEMDIALTAFDHLGKGRHPAALNMGDCFAYAVAKSHDVPLLYKGEDFAKTDLARPQ